MHFQLTRIANNANIWRSWPQFLNYTPFFHVWTVIKLKINTDRFSRFLGLELGQATLSELAMIPPGINKELYLCSTSIPSPRSLMKVLLTMVRWSSSSRWRATAGHDGSSGLLYQNTSRQTENWRTAEEARSIFYDLFRPGRCLKGRAFSLYVTRPAPGPDWRHCFCTTVSLPSSEEKPMAQNVTGKQQHHRCCGWGGGGGGHYLHVNVLCPLPGLKVLQLATKPTDRHVCTRTVDIWYSGHIYETNKCDSTAQHMLRECSVMCQTGSRYHLPSTTETIVSYTYSDG